jgi:hypothetical protein
MRAADLKRGDIVPTTDFMDAPTFARVSGVAMCPPNVHAVNKDEVRYRIWVTPVYRGDDIVSSFTAASDEDIATVTL